MNVVNDHRHYEVTATRQGLVVWCTVCDEAVLCRGNVTLDEVDRAVGEHYLTVSRAERAAAVDPRDRASYPKSRAHRSAS
jgi:hypothetical protein